MVKTPRGRMLGRRHARIMKKRGQRRQRARLVQELEQLSASTPDTVSTATTSSSYSKKAFAYAYGIGKDQHPDYIDPRSLCFSDDEGVMEGLEPARQCDEEEYKKVTKYSTLRLYSSDSEVARFKLENPNYDQPIQVPPHKNSPIQKLVDGDVFFRNGAKNADRRVSESEAADVCVNDGNSVDRPSVSESGLHDAIPMPPPPTPNEEEAEVILIQAPSVERMQHSDEETDRYLSHLFTPSVANITTACGEVDTRSDEFQRLRNLFSSVRSATSPTMVTFDNTSSTRPETLPGLRHYSSHDTATFGLRSLFADGGRQQEGLPAEVSEQSLGLNTLFNNTRTLESSCENTTSMGLRTLFEEGFNEEGQYSAPETTASTLGLRTLFNQEEDAGNLLRSTASTLGLRTLFLQDNKEDADGNLRTLSHVPSLASSASLLGNLFGSEHAIHGAATADQAAGKEEEDEGLSAKERMKVLIAQDLAQYLDGDGTSPGSRHSSSLSTFVQQIDNLFANYRLAVKQIERLEKEVARTKKDQQKE